MDETGVPLDPRPSKVVAKKGQRKVCYHCSGQKGQITVIGYANATGHTVPPFITFAAKQFSHNWMKDELPGTRYSIRSYTFTSLQSCSGGQYQKLVAIGSMECQ